MKKIEAIIRRERLGPVRKALEAVGYPGMTLTEVKGHGRQKGHLNGQGDTARSEYLPKLKLEIVVEDEEAPAITEAIISRAQTGHIGDGKVFISTIDTVVRVRTREEGKLAI
ncbi:MAG: P-II family nitrogen regulator [Dehalococcoidia bacterium]|nr:P-II family nitrogen regulator [Dehalococcoidia bacterium]